MPRALILKASKIGKFLCQEMCGFNEEKISFYGSAKEFEKQTKMCKDLIKDFAHEFIKNGIVRNF